MLSDLVIQNFQSIEEARLRLGLFTVVTGPTGSGKSGSLRALSLAAFNRRGNEFIRHGAKKAVVALGCQDEGWVIAIERGQATRTDQYRAVTPDPDDQEAPPRTWTYTKLGGEAPDEITELHRLTSLNFAGQLDRPFLLDESGSQVARMLGELTNVSLVFEAAREAARRKSTVAGNLRRTDALVAQLTEQAARYADLAARRAAQERAEQALAAAQKHAARSSRLTQLLLAQETAQATVAAAQQRLAAVAPPSLDRVTELAARRARLRALLSQANDAENDIETFSDYVSQLAGQEDKAHEAVHQALVAAGTCPMCRQEVR